MAIIKPVINSFLFTLSSHIPQNQFNRTTMKINQKNKKTPPNIFGPIITLAMKSPTKTPTVMKIILKKSIGN
tara:strand:- start:975 stop:1190 length:216 start_codon:yes stop_codon:yes gene_type:complete